ncbi:hypothetical protein SEUCBS139899_010026 [Sporothrix eucalyptigena]|uniref:Cupin type-2 domain-containing protein n=1 Tax=Sporothrix eucalyptigena TaxID=1812306 RepID=A0ABP0ATJ6_9PEZI
MALQGKLRHPKRFITGHNDKGESILVDDAVLGEDAPFYELPNLGGVGFAQAYVTRGFPMDIKGDATSKDGADLGVYKDFLANAPGLTVSDGTVLRYVDMPPGSTSAMHRTVSVDYGILLEGEIELILDSGEKRIMTRGDVCIQRATMHAWRNCSDTEWGRMLYILQPCQPFKIAGQEDNAKEDYGTLKGALKDSA